MHRAPPQLPRPRVIALVRSVQHESPRVPHGEHVPPGDPVHAYPGPHGDPGLPPFTQNANGQQGPFGVPHVWQVPWKQTFWELEHACPELQQAARCLHMEERRDLPDTGRAASTPRPSCSTRGSADRTRGHRLRRHPAHPRRRRRRSAPAAVETHCRCRRTGQDVVVADGDSRFLPPGEQGRGGLTSAR